jgi:uncharacterized membrane protein
MSKRSERNKRRQQELQKQVIERAVGLQPNSPLPPQLITAFAQISTSFSGPIPPPEMLKHYEEIVPGSAKTLIDVFNDQAHHRMDLEKRSLVSDRRRSWGGLISAVLVSLVCIGTGGWLVHEGHDEAGAAIVALDIVGLAGTFIYGTQSQRKERTEKARIMTGHK